MHFLSAIWQWFLTVQTTGSLVRTQNDALIAIASVSAVVWTGGLIAWQIKAWTLSRNFALDMLQTAFMASIISLVAHPPTFRIVATFFLLYYGIGSIVGLAKNRNGDTWNKWFGKKYPTSQPPNSARMLRRAIESTQRSQWVRWFITRWLLCGLTQPSSRGFPRFLYTTVTRN